MKKGTVYLIGAGPGDPGLFTLKGKEILERADVVVYDRLVGDEIVSMADAGAELVYVGKESGRHALSQDKINELLVKKAGEGKTVARLKGGDPFLYGRGGEEAEYIIQCGFDYEVIPGITSAIAVPAYAGIPVTHRDMSSSFAVITGHEKPGKKVSSIKWDKIAAGIDTLVFLMGVENLEYISSKLIENGRSPETPVALIRWGTWPIQRLLSGTLSNINAKVKEGNFKPPAVIVVGDVVQLRDELKWLEKKPLWGKKIVVTRSREQASVLVRKIRELGGMPLEYPTIEIEKEIDLSRLHQAIREIESYNWLVFTSVNAIDIFFQELSECKRDIRDLKGLKLCAIGPATAGKLVKMGLQVDVVPSEYRAEGMIQALQPLVKSGERVLMPRAKGAREILPASLEKLGLAVDEIGIYTAVPAAGQGKQIPDMIREGIVDYITFTSSSTVKNFIELLGSHGVEQMGNKIRIACIGPVTAEQAQKSGLSVDLIADEYTIDGLITSILNDSSIMQGSGA